MQDNGLSHVSADQLAFEADKPPAGIIRNLDQIPVYGIGLKR